MADDALRDELDELLAGLGGDDEAIEKLVRKHLRVAIYLFQQHFMVRAIRDLPRELFESGDIGKIADHLPAMSERVDASLREFNALLRDEIHRVNQSRAELPN